MNDIIKVINGVKPVSYSSVENYDKELAKLYPIEALRCLMNTSDISEKLFKATGLYQYLERNSWIDEPLAKQLDVYFNQLIKVILAKSRTLTSLHIEEIVDLLRLADIYVKSFTSGVYKSDMGSYLLSKVSNLTSDYMSQIKDCLDELDNEKFSHLPNIDLTIVYRLLLYCKVCYKGKVNTLMNLGLDTLETQLSSMGYFKNNVEKFDNKIWSKYIDDYKMYLLSVKTTLAS